MKVGRRLNALKVIGILVALNFINPISTTLDATSQDNLTNAKNSLVPSASVKNKYHSCETNPYKNVINKTFNEIIEDVNDWIDEKQFYAQVKAVHSNYSGHDHRRFFPFEIMAPCNDLQCIGGPCSDDKSKVACGINYLSQLEDCVIYSIGGNNFWEFENDLLQKTRCQIHTFDCTGKLSRFTPPTNDRLHFHHICLGAVSLDGVGSDHPTCDYKTLCGDTWTFSQIQQHFKHDKIDLLKLDIEGWEWPIFDSEYTNVSMPMQLLMEVHYDWHGHGTRGVIHNETMSSAKDLVRLQSHLLGFGYAVSNRDDNPSCRHCTEVTLLRVAC